MRAGAALVCFLVAASMPFIAKAADPCANAISTIQINKCLETRHAARDKALNAAYQDLLKRLVPTDRLDKTDFPRARKHLVDAQRVWITFRDEDCKGRLVIYEAGTIRNAVYMLCQIEHTEQRTLALRAWADVPGSRTPSEPYSEAPRKLYRGTLTQQEDRLLLAPCDGGRAVRVRDVSPEVIITAAITDLGFDRVKRLHFEAYGSMLDGELLIDRLNRAGIEMGCSKEQFGMRAQGNEPGWFLESGSAGVKWTRQGEATLRAPPTPLSWQGPSGDQPRPRATLELATRTVALSAVLTPRICRDSMADAVYGFTAQIQQARPEPVIDFKGCAYLGSERMP